MKTMNSHVISSLWGKTKILLIFTYLGIKLLCLGRSFDVLVVSSDIDKP